MAVSRRSARPRFVLVVLVLASITLITLDVRGGGTIPGLRGRARDLFSPVQSAADSVTHPVTDFFHGVFEYSQLRDDNRRLRQQVAALRAAQIRDQYLQQDNRDLLAINKIQSIEDIPTVPARVVGGSESNFQLTIVIDRGANAGILVGMPVVAAGGLVGRVVEASAGQSTVMLITDASMAVGVQFAPNPAVGVAGGQGAGRPLAVTLGDPSVDVPVGTAAVTSGLEGSPYPRGIPVGTVSQDIPQPGIRSHAVALAPVVDFRRVSYVDVLIWTSQTHPVVPSTTVPAIPTTVVAPTTSTTVGKR